MERNQISFAKHIDISALLSTAILLLGAIVAPGCRDSARRRNPRRRLCA